MKKSDLYCGSPFHRLLHHVRWIGERIFFPLFISFPTFTIAQTDWLQMNVNYGGNSWTFPVPAQSIQDITVSSNHQNIIISTNYLRSIQVPYLRSGFTDDDWLMSLDSITIADSLSNWGRDKYRVFAINISTEDGADITSKETYVPCYVSVDARGQYPQLGISGRVRGRGNSTWSWYEKKPYRIKFDQGNKMLGIAKDKDWVLLANWRDVSKVMNTFCSLAADYMGIPFTTPIRFAELFINGEYKGLYQVAEQVEVGNNRVEIDETEGILLTLDEDDGPNHSPGSGDNFWSTVYHLPVCVKYPKDLTAEQLDSLKAEFAHLEQAISYGSYSAADSLMDMKSFIAMLQLQELAFNVELEAPRSIFLFRDKGSKWTWGPAWDWDAGFDFSWSDMYTGHTYFKSYQTSLLGTDPYHRVGARTNNLNHFFSDMFQNRKFTEQFKNQWASYSDSIVAKPWEETLLYVNGLEEAQKLSDGSYTSPQQREDERWPVSGFTASNERLKMKKWLKNRLSYLNSLFNVIPLPEEKEDPIIPDLPDEYILKGTLTKNYTLTQSNGYSQNFKVKTEKSELASILGVDASALNSSTLTLVPLNADGSEGNNTANGSYGAWFDNDGNTTNFSGGYPYVYLESDDLFSWSCGCHPTNSSSGNDCTVTMQYRHAATASAVNVRVTFSIDTESGGGWPWWW
ncbi:MAG: CotH kinase family protein [Bacteroidaceae bacterium]|nr:CotH kinase family protein [Bacteroidaceae bacterium]